MMTMTTNNSHTTDIIERLNAMTVQESTTPSCFNYFNNNINSNNKFTLNQDLNETSRKSMVTWITQVQTTLSLSPESVWIGMSFFDRYLSSNKGQSQQVLNNKAKFQLAAITSFYTAVKIYEPVVLGMDILIQICRGTYSEMDITSMENEILNALDWRVSCHTPMEFARHLLELLPEEDDIPSCQSEVILEECQKNLDCTIADMYFSSLAPSVVGIGCLASALTKNNTLTLSEKQTIWSRLSSKEECKFDLSSKEVIAVIHRLDPPTTSHDASSKLTTTSSQSNNHVLSVPSSPVCVTQVARQA
mmetsp:Transcript_7084/g.11523  ORF Transcript_7084/g.11523 Transcript_7084/m.11523 type:complete len:304 (+) Transcript_7084:70-981(+)